MTTFVNLTPHAINIVGKKTTTIPTSGTVVRVSMTRTTVSTDGNIPITRVVYGPVVGLPEPADDTVFIVSGLVRVGNGRPDLASPGQLVRDIDGKVMGCESLDMD